jgi:predicted DNA-binding transcriptional regulator AlpA
MEFIFTLRYRLDLEDGDLATLVERLGANGCTDATVGIGHAGRMALEFARDAVSAERAVSSALAEVRSAIPTAHLTEAAPDFVGLTEVAALLGLSRQNMRKLMLAHRSSFPAPVHEGTTSIWHLADLLAWLEARGYEFDPGLLELSRVTCAVNLAMEKRRHPGLGTRAFASLIG